jgi:hypothetical protein
MKTQACAAIVATIALGVASASAQNTSGGTNAQANPTQTQPATTHQREAARTTPASVPAAAQQDTNPTTTSPPASHAQVEPPSGKNTEIGTATINPTGIPPSQRNPLLADNGEVRVSKLIGTTIYNKDDQKVGSVDDVLAGQNGQLEVVVSTSNKKIVVPWDRMVFGDAKLNSDNKVLIPDTTQKQLDKMQAFNSTRMLWRERPAATAIYAARWIGGVAPSTRSAMPAVWLMRRSEPGPLFTATVKLPPSSGGAALGRSLHRTDP